MVIGSMKSIFSGIYIEKTASYPHESFKERRAGKGEHHLRKMKELHFLKQTVMIGEM